VAEDDVHRLRDILVEEVSLVDRAANKRRFLLVKREDDMSELRSDGHGGFTRVRKGEDDETEKAKKKPPFEGAAKPFGAKPEDDEDEEKSKKKADDADEDEAKSKKKADDETVKAAGAELTTKLNDIIDDLQDVAEKMGDDDEDEPNDVHMKKLLAAHRKLGGMAESYIKRTAKKSIEVAKIGRKMSASRLAMYKEALATLQSLLSDLMDSPKKDKDHEPDAGDPQLAAPGWKPANPSASPGNGTGAAAMKSQLTKGFGELIDLLKRSQTEIARLKKGVVPSNALAIDGVRKNRDDEAVVWPVDMNRRPPSDKSESFLDE
jgi:hypothetical protein